LTRFVGQYDTVERHATVTGDHGARQGETVLVVDDEPGICTLIIEVLTELDYVVIEASDASSGLKILDSQRTVDLLITDIGLPGGMNGSQLAEEARLTRPGLKILFITGYAQNAISGDAELKPDMHILTKPFSLETLAAQVKDILSG
jgi:DNA-binding NtrC family response regulator